MLGAAMDARAVVPEDLVPVVVRSRPALFLCGEAGAQDQVPGQPSSAIHDVEPGFPNPLAVPYRQRFANLGAQTVGVLERQPLPAAAVGAAGHRLAFGLEQRAVDRLGQLAVVEFDGQVGVVLDRERRQQLERLSLVRELAQLERQQACAEVGELG